MPESLINLTRYLSFQTLVLLFFSTSALLAEDSDVQVEIGATLTKHPQADFHIAEFDLGTLPCDGKVELTLRLKNPYDKKFTFTGMSKTCNCMDLKTMKREVAPNSTLEFTMILKTPSTASTEDVFASITLVDENSEERRRPITLRLKYKLSGILSIEPNLISKELPEGDTEIEIDIPVFMTLPIKKEDVKLEKAYSLQDIEFRWSENKGGENTKILTAFVPAELLSGGPASGELRISHEETGRKDGVFLLLRQGADVQISPSALRFVRTQPDSDSDKVKLTANALLRLPKATEQGEKIDSRTFTSSNNPEADSPEVDASIGGRSCSVSVKKLAKRVYKLKLTFETTDREKLSGESIKWRVKYKSKTSEIVSRLMLAN